MPTRAAESAAAAGAGLLFGYAVAAVNTVLASMRAELDLSSVETGIVVSAVPAGALLGCVVAGALVGRIGPRRALMLAGFVAGLGSLATAAADTCMTMALTRALVGAGVGLVTVTTPIFVADRADPRRRGIVLTAYQLSITVGILVAWLAGWAAIDLAHWRWALALNALPAVLVMISAALSAADRADHSAPETPGDVGDRPETGAGRSAVRAAAVVAVAASLMNALTGVGLVMYYSTDIFASVMSGGGQAAVVSSVLVGAANVVASVAAVPLIARIDRRPLLITGLIGMAAALGAVGASVMLTRSPIAPILAVTGTIAFMAFFAISAGPLAWLILAEVAPARYRNALTSWAVAANWAINLLLTIFFPIVVGSPPDNRTVMLCYAGFLLSSLGFAAFVFRFVPETRGLTLEEIQSRFLARQSVRD